MKRFPFCREMACGLLFTFAAGCSTIGDTLGISPPSHKLLDEAKQIRDTAPIPAPIGRELAKEPLPPHIVLLGDALLIQPVDLDSPVRLPSDLPVQPDGTIDLGKYGRPVVVGKTLPQIEALASDLIKAQEKQGTAITVRLVGRSSSVYYVFGEVNAPGSFPITGRETVLDGIVAAGGVTKKASRQNVILSRPTSPDGCRLVYPVCLPQIVQLGDTTTNYQLLPGDRIYVPGQGIMESLFPSRCQTPCPACSRPQSSCFGGGCVQPALATAVRPNNFTIPNNYTPAGISGGKGILPTPPTVPIPGTPVTGLPVQNLPDPGLLTPSSSVPGVPISSVGEKSVLLSNPATPSLGNPKATNQSDEDRHE